MRTMIFAKQFFAAATLVFFSVQAQVTCLT